MEIDRRKLRARFTALVMLSILSWPLSGGIVGSYYRYLLIHNRAIGTATLTGEYWGGHAQYNYRYEVGGKEYTGTSSRDYKSKRYGDAGIGARVPVYYSVDHPSVSSLFVPESTITALPWYVIVLTIWVLFLITVVNPDSNWAMNLGQHGLRTI